MDSPIPWRWAATLVGIPLALGLGVYFATVSESPYRNEWSGPKVDWAAAGYSTPDKDVVEFEGDEHCNWQDIRFLAVPSPVLRAAGFLPARSDPYLLYAGDLFEPHGAAVEESAGTVAGLPDDSVRTPYHDGRRTLWLAADFERALYIQEKDRIERWVRFRGGCS